MKRILVGALVSVGAALMMVTGVMANSLSPICDSLDDKQKDAAGCSVSGDELVNNSIPGAVTALFSIAGMLAVGMIIYGGVRYATSAGDGAKVKNAKNTIMYAVVGLVITITSFAIVNFVVGSFGGDGTGGNNSSGDNRDNSSGEDEDDDTSTVDASAAAERQDADDGD